MDVTWSGLSWSFAFDELPPSGEVPALAALDATHVLVVYTDGMGSQRAAILEDNGAVTGPFELSEGRFSPSLAVTDDSVYLAWREFAGADLDDNYIQQLTWDGSVLTVGETWTLPHDAPYLAGDQRRPALSGVGSVVWAAWDDLRQGQATVHGDVRVSLMPTPIERAESGE